MIDQTRRCYFAPDEDTIAPFIAFVNGATKKIRVAIYSLNLAPLVDALIARQEAGVDVYLLLDKTQAAGISEHVQVERLRKAAVPFLIGTSDQHQILHDKFTVVDDEWVEYGSWNYTATAAKEANSLMIEHNPDLAKVFSFNWEVMRAWIAANEAQPA